MKRAFKRAFIVMSLIGFSTLALAAAAPTCAQVRIQMHKEPNAKAPAIFKQPIKTLSKDELQKFLSQRIDGRISNGTFRDFSNMYFVMSRIEIGKSIALATDDKDVSTAYLEPAYPASYQPTVQELLDAVALQSDSRWVYEEQYQVVYTETENRAAKKSMDSVVVFQFLPREKPLPFKINTVEGWTTVPRTNWMMYIPSGLQCGMDIHMQGRVSADSDSDLAKLLSRMPREAALENLQRARPDATVDDLKKVKVGKYDAYFFQQALPPKGEEKVRWRQWHFMVGDRLMYAISTLPVEVDDKLYPEVEKMLASFETVDAPKTSLEVKPSTAWLLELDRWEYSCR